MRSSKDGSGPVDRVAHVGDRAHGARAQSGAFHDRGVQLDLPVGELRQAPTPPASAIGPDLSAVC